MDDALLLQKYHGLGNDYLVLDPNKNKIHLLERHIVKLCRRNIGAGADGILYGPIWQDEKLYVKIFNPDGSEAERSGNGVRIFAKYLLDAGYIRHRPFSLYTKAGEVRIDFLNEDGSLMKVNMGIPQFTGGVLAYVGTPPEIINRPLVFHDHPYRATCVSMGNPHVITYVDDEKTIDIEKIGPLFESNPVFPERTNTEFIRVADRKNIYMRVWERGTGETLACGTGACASAVATMLNGLCDRRVTVHLLGGDLFIEWDEKTNHLFMTGPSHTVFESEIDASHIIG